MLSALSDATVDLFNHQSDEAKSKTLTVLATFANITKCMLGKEEFYSKLSNDTELLCEQVFEISPLEFVLTKHQVMTGAIILYDHVNPTGAFDKTTQIDVKGAIKLLQRSNTNDAMLNALRYTTKTINNESTQKSIKALLEVK